MIDRAALTDNARPSAAATPRRTGLSKSRIAIFEQCAKRLWLSVHRPELAHEGAATTRSFRIGHEVGAVACSLYPDGIMIDASTGLADAARATSEALRSPDRRPIFEATFIHDNVVVRVDLLLPDGDGWHVAEVKSTTRVKPYQRADLATQLWVMKACGVSVTRASVRVIDTRFVLETLGDYRGLFVDVDADEAVTSAVAARPAMVAAANDTLASDEPNIGIGAHCSEPFYCSFETYCRRDLPAPPAWPTTLLPGAAGKALAGTLAVLGIDDLTQVDPAIVTRPLLQRVQQATLSGTAYHDAAGVIADAAGWSYPRTFLDFESIAFAVPRWIGTRPYQQVPFQFSAHIDQGDGELAHAEFLSTDGNDPRRRCAEVLAALPTSGAVIAWNASFERACLLALADHAPEHGEALRSLAARLVDLLPVARRHYYHRDMRGSWSIKAVLPTLAPEMDYQTLDGARSGIEAQDLYLETMAPDTSAARHGAIRRELLAYCERDTLAMAVVLVRLCDPPTRATTVTHYQDWPEGTLPS
ncbi:DUF2779 domain-containing protein [Sphingomonas rubra]|uniref:DUF2779 domain-containing protein n=1 Tax=Sphingomonas rubra TaxID=634430 RepID=A0A1I5TMB3_9SPHN|nr:DUF2779 domain-containing protein [Sphingomonas rubra]SFP84189.1 protein of unknown function [Sphingomonas rubra]